MFVRSLLAAGSMVALASAAQAVPITSFTESLTAPQAPTGAITTVIGLQSVATPSTTGFSGPGYSVSFSSVPAGQGVVQGASPGLHAIPVAGVSGGTPLYLTGDSLTGPLTGNAAASGKYLSTGNGAAAITITFNTAQTSFAFLAGSIDSSNLITLSNGDTLSGAQLQAVPGFAGNGNQGFGGSAYVAFTDRAFTSVTLSSGVISFEIAGLVGSNTPFQVPEPMSLAVFGAGLAGLGLLRRRSRG